jgi:starch synthase (maltosyl-transferring)
MSSPDPHSGLHPDLHSDLPVPAVHGQPVASASHAVPPPAARLSVHRHPAKPALGRARAVVEAVSPEINSGRFAAKRSAGESLHVEADIFTDGHDLCDARLLFRHASARQWQQAPMHLYDNDRWSGSFALHSPGEYLFTVEAWVDHFLTWRYDMQKRLAAAQSQSDPSSESADLPTDTATLASGSSSTTASGSSLTTASTTAVPRELLLQLRIAASLISAASRRARSPYVDQLRRFSRRFKAAAQGTSPLSEIAALALDTDLLALMQRFPDRRFATRYPRHLPVWVDSKRARFSAWYELFPRSTASVTDTATNTPAHGSFDTVIERIPYVAGMGFDVLYLPPISPIGEAFRKGPNNAVVAAPTDFGSPWAIGSSRGGHTAIHPQLGTLADFHRLIAHARAQGLSIALDIAFQCSPDHPWVTEHPSFFKHRPDGTIQYAENPPKKYQDIYPLDFESTDWTRLWDELLEVFLYWIDHGVHIFRVDNPHTKPFAFWEWVIAAVHESHPDVIFLAEAFTRPKVMYRLAKVGFTQSYTYFTWRNTGPELREYLEELTTPPPTDNYPSTSAPANFFRPNFWPNTPDILHAQLQSGNRAMFTARVVLAATLSSNYGIYGPAFELLEHLPIRPGAEEYLDSEKYEVRSWDLARPDSIRPLLARINAARRAHPALQSNDALVFHDTDNPQLLCYSKTFQPPVNADFAAPSASSAPSASAEAPASTSSVPSSASHSAAPDRILVIVNLDPDAPQAGFTALDLSALRLNPDQPFHAEDLLAGAFDAPNPPDLDADLIHAAASAPNTTYTWQHARNFVSLPPGHAHILRLTQPA